MRLARLLEYAVRDSRGTRKRLILFSLCIVFGVAALVAVGSFRENLSATIDREAKTLLGADFAVRALRPFSDRAEVFFDSLGGEQARLERFTTMAYMPEQQATRLVQARALEGNYPFYGAIKTEPENASIQTEVPTVLVDETFAIQFGLEVDDILRLGTLDFKVAGVLLKISGENDLRGSFAPRVYFDRRHLEKTGLTERGSVTRHTVYFKFEEGQFPYAKIEEAKGGLFQDENLRHETVESRKENLAETLSDVSGYMNLAGFVALVLGGFGVAGAARSLAREKKEAVAVFRCLGMETQTAVGIFVLQLSLVGLLGSLLGAALGVGIQYAFPAVLAPLLPVDVVIFFVWDKIAYAVFFGWVMISLFAVIPLLDLRHVSPLVAIRADFENSKRRIDPYKVVCAFIVAALSIGYCFLETEDPRHAAGFVGGIAAVLLCLTAIAYALRFVVRRGIGSRGNFVLRQGLANLYRPRNRTVFLTTTFGLGVFLLLTLFLTENLLLGRLSETRGEDQPNLILFDIQTDQLEDVTRSVKKAGSPIIETSPIITMRVSSINGRSVADIRRDPARQSEKWALDWEYRSSYRGHLNETESILRGEFIPEYSGEGPVPVTVEEGNAKDLAVDVGDLITFDVQGIPIETQVVGIRKVDWTKVRTNFYVVFPTGILEEAPAFYALVSRTEDRATTAALQQEIVLTHPNVSSLDVGLVLETVSEILDQVAFVLRFMAAFTVGAGIFVLGSVFAIGKEDRLRESALLRTLGASSRQIRLILMVEYAATGILAALAGIILSLGASWALAVFVFDAEYSIPTLPLLVAFVVTVGTVVSLGFLNSRNVVNHPPLTVLRRS